MHQWVSQHVLLICIGGPATHNLSVLKNRVHSTTIGWDIVVCYVWELLVFEDSFLQCVSVTLMARTVEQQT